MALEAYNLREMRYRIREEFGIAQSDELEDRIIENKINEAMSEVVRRRPNWPWQRKNLALNISASSAFTADFTQGSAAVANTSIQLTARDVIQAGNTTSYSSIYTVKSATATSAVLEHQYLGATVTGKACTKGTGYILLPTDFLRLDTAVPFEDLASDHCFDYLPFSRFEHARRKFYTTINHYYYTVQTDPLGLNSSWYLAVYPYITDLMVIRGNYFADPPRLEGDDDEPMMPRNDRPALLYFAMYLYALKAKDDNAAAYLQRAETEIANMMSRYEMSDDMPPDRDRFYPYEVPRVDYTEPPSSPDFIPS